MSSSATVHQCDYCQLPVSGAPPADDEPAFCCFGCRLAAEITGQSGAEGDAQWTLVRLGLAIFLTINVMMFTMALWTQDLYDARAVGSGPLASSLADVFRYLCLLLSLPVLWLLGLPLLDNAISSRKRGITGTDLLVVVGVLAAYIYSAVSVVRGAGHVYFEVACAVLVMVTVGRWLEATGKLRTTAALEALESLLPDRVRFVDDDGSTREINSSEVQKGDRIRVLAGERVATDGIILHGCASINEQLLTGESAPVVKVPGDELLSGSLNLDGDLTVQVTAPADQGSLARLVHLVRTARLSKGRYQRLADRVSTWFLQAVLVLAAMTFVVHTWQGSLETAIMASLAVLLISCPCALGLATPMAVWTALGTAAQRGVLFRSGESLERLAAIRAVRFDKTGTLTTGTPRVEKFLTATGENTDRVAQRAAVLAGASTHVFARAIQDLWNSADDCAPHSMEMSDARTVAGCGIRALLGAPCDEVLLGSIDWLIRSGQGLPPDLREAVELARIESKSFSGIAWGGTIRGLFIFAETLRAEARTALAQCRELGCEVGVLTGDTEQRGNLLGQQLSVKVEAGLLPEAKLASLERLRETVGPTAMVGDGVNDAPALAASDVGIALGCGTDLARESAPVALLSNNLLQVPWAIQLARRSVRVMRQNLCWAFSYNIIGIGLAATGWLNPAWAAAAMVGSSLLVVGNSMRLQAAAGDTAEETDPPSRARRPEVDATESPNLNPRFAADPT